MRKVYSIFVMGIALVLVSVAFTSVPVSGTIYDFNIYDGQWSYTWYWWDTGGTRAVTLWVDVDYVDLYGWVDIYFFDQTNYNLYVSYVTSGGTLPSAILKKEYYGIGTYTWNFNFNPVAGANYYVVIDNTDSVGGSASYQAIGNWELTLIGHTSNCMDTCTNLGRALVYPARPYL